MRTDLCASGEECAYDQASAHSEDLSSGTNMGARRDSGGSICSGRLHKVRNCMCFCLAWPTST